MEDSKSARGPSQIDSRPHTEISRKSAPSGLQPSPKSADHQRGSAELESPHSTHHAKSSGFVTFPRLLPKPKDLSTHILPPLTGATALADARRHRELMEQDRSRQTSPNPAVAALNALRGGLSMSRPNDAVKASETGASVSPGNGPNGDVSRRQSASSGGGGSFQAQKDPVHRDGVTNDGEPSSVPHSRSSMDRSSGFPPQESDTLPPKDDELQPQSSDPPSRPAKRHKCPYCATDFTRHHNLKSHLLTHSQEKPYTCQTCPSQFRRLHDLKRHAKLHSGERPHLCPSCGRRFARGDALARHTRGPLGCAGRRSDFGGSAAGDDDSGDLDIEDTMDGVQSHTVDGKANSYDPRSREGHGHGHEHRDEEGSQSRSRSEPGRRKRARYDDSPNTHQHQPTYGTYPPYPRPFEQSSQPAMAPPDGRAESGRAPSLTEHTHPRGPPAAGVIFGRGSITESPGPLSPAIIADQHHQQNQQQRSGPPFRTSFSERSSHGQVPGHGHGRGHGPSSYPPQGPYHGINQTAPQPPIISNQLPSISGLGQPPHPPHRTHDKSPYQSTHPSQSLPHPLQHQTSDRHPVSHASSISSNHSHSGGSLREHLGPDQDVWGYVRSLEQRFSRMQDEYELRLSRLQEDVIALKQRVVQR